MEIVEKIRKNTKKFTAAVVSVGLGASAAAGFAVMEDNSDLNDSLNMVDPNDDEVTNVDSQIEENKQRLETVAASSDKEVKYTRLGC